MTLCCKSLSTLTALMLAGLLFASPAQAQNDLDREIGYIDFDRLDALFPTLPRVEVNVKGSLLRLAVEASRHEDAQLAEVLSRLRAVQVRMYELPADDAGTLERHVGDITRGLTRGGWDTVVRVRGDDQNIDVHLREAGDLISGLMVSVIDNSSKEATFVNIVGNIDPAEIALIGRRFNIQPLSTLGADPSP